MICLHCGCGPACAGRAPRQSPALTPGQRRRRRRLDPDTGEVLPTWDQALDAITDQDQPLHVVQFGSKFDAQGALAGSRESSRCIGYLTKHLTKHLGDCRQVTTDYQAAHAGRLADALHYEPCPACPARCAARPVSPCPAHKRTPGTGGELAFDSQKTDRNYKNPLTGNGKCPRFQGIADPAARMTERFRGNAWLLCERFRTTG